MCQLCLPSQSNHTSLVWTFWMMEACVCPVFLTDLQKTLVSPVVEMQPRMAAVAAGPQSPQLLVGPAWNSTLSLTHEGIHDFPLQSQYCLNLNSGPVHSLENFLELVSLGKSVAPQTFLDWH